MDEIKKVFRAIFDNPAILIALIVVVVIVFIILIRNQNSTVTASNAGGYGPNAQNGPGYYLQEIFTPPPNISVSNQQTTGGVSVTGSGTQTITKTVPAQYTKSGVMNYILSQPINKGRTLVDQIEQLQRQELNQKAQKKLVGSTGPKGKAVRG
jgi:hypothetical protein